MWLFTGNWILTFCKFFVECKVLIESYMSGRAVVPVLKMYFQDFFVWTMLHWQRKHWFFVIVKIERKLIDQGTKQTASLPTPKFTFNLKGCFFRKTYFGKWLNRAVCMCVCRGGGFWMLLWNRKELKPRSGNIWSLD